MITTSAALASEAALIVVDRDRCGGFRVASGDAGRPRVLGLGGLGVRGGASP
jgi:hypothetical protein